MGAMDEELEETTEEAGDLEAGETAETSVHPLKQPGQLLRVVLSRPQVLATGEDAEPKGALLALMQCDLRVDHHWVADAIRNGKAQVVPAEE